MKYLFSIFILLFLTGCSFAPYPDNWVERITYDEFSPQIISGSYSNPAFIAVASNSTDIKSKPSIDVLVGERKILYPKYFKLSFIDKNTFKMKLFNKENRNYREINFIAKNESGRSNLTVKGNYIKIEGDCEFTLDTPYDYCICDTLSLYAGKDGSLIVKYKPLDDAPIQWIKFNRFNE